jgi:hypothetical protein
MFTSTTKSPLNNTQLPDTTSLPKRTPTTRVSNMMRTPSIKASLTVLALIMMTNNDKNQFMMTPQIRGVNAAEETILCSIDEDCLPLNDYFLCKDISQED